MRSKAIFVDRDGVVNRLVDRGENTEVAGKKVRYTAPWRFEEFEMLPGVEAALRAARAAHFLCILVTNQPDLAYGLLSHEDHEKIMEEVRKLPFDDIVVCPHGRTEGCLCKKPKPGMLLEAARKWNINIKSSYCIGDTRNDIEAGRAAGCTTILVCNETTDADVPADLRARSLSEAVSLIATR